MPNAAVNLPLSRYTVLDLTIARAGPAAVRLLADWGAEVIRIDSPPDKEVGGVTGRRDGSDEQNLHRNKRSICIDLKTPAGAEILQKLIAKADVVVENFRASVKKRLGVTYEQLKAVNPRIILASISGFGQDGPYSSRPGVDQIVQGMSGLMSVTGEPGRGPMRVGVAISDTSAGMFLGQGILLALLHREHTGAGQWVHTSLLESMLNKLDFQGARYTMSGEIAGQEGNGHPTNVPMSAYPAKDGMVNIAASSGKMWAALCNALDAGALKANPDFKDSKSRAANRKSIDAAIGGVTERFTVTELVERLNPVGVPCGPINNIGQAFEDPQVKHLRMTRPAQHRKLGEVQLLRSPINLSAFPHPAGFHHAAPDPGEHSADLLRELGYGDVAIAGMKADGAIT